MSNNVKSIENRNEEKQAETRKEGFVVKLRRKWDLFKMSPVGKWTIRAATGMTIGGTGFLCYKAGQKSAKPVTVYIREGVDEIETPAEEETEET